MRCIQAAESSDELDVHGQLPRSSQCDWVTLEVCAGSESLVAIESGVAQTFYHREDQLLYAGPYSSMIFTIRSAALPSQYSGRFPLRHLLWMMKRATRKIFSGSVPTR